MKRHRDLTVDEREEIRKNFSMADYDELLREIDEVLAENEAANCDGTNCRQDHWELKA